MRRIGAGFAALAAAATEPDVILAGDGRGRFVLPALGPGPDAISALMMLLSLMADTELSLSQLNARIPATSVLSRTVHGAVASAGRRPCARCASTPRVRGRHARRHPRRAADDGSWCLVLPEDDQACLTLYAEASDTAAAERLLDHWQRVVEAVS